MPKVRLFCSWCGARFVAYPSQQRFCTAACAKACHGAVRKMSVEPYDVDDATGCWNWNWGLTTNGYGKIRVGKRTRLAHIIEWEKVNGPAPAGSHLHHVCENRRCVNPKHVTPKAPRAHLRHHAHLTEDDVREIRRLRASLPGAEVARRFGISQSTVSNIVHRVTWSDVD